MAINNLVGTAAEPITSRKGGQIPKTTEIVESQALADPRKKAADDDIRGATKALKRPADTVTELSVPRIRARTMAADSPVKADDHQRLVDTAVESTDPEIEGQIPTVQTEADAQRDEDLYAWPTDEIHTFDPAVEFGTSTQGTIRESPVTENVLAKANIQATAEQHSISNSIPTTPASPPLDTLPESPIYIEDNSEETGTPEDIHREADIPTATQHSMSSPILLVDDTPSPDTTEEPHEGNMMSQMRRKENIQTEANIERAAEEQSTSDTIPTAAVTPPGKQPPPYTDQFFADLASTVSQSFPFKAFAASHNCSISEVSQAINAVIVGPLSDPDFHWHEDSGITISRFGRHMIATWKEHCRVQARNKPALVPALSRGPPASAQGKPKKKVRFDLPEDVEG
ncbi:uncharacterized protein BO80DRAFT_109811 [Aspergillus ibericus CBS 121593]|uniref:Uncharacterized protein n=1 Tax=Aspergillus ibericus CBS 121593 TaxID=1448316 RepID=A0A395GZW5_9EURO|nr:hypothetical protein BO80DRAFT_109811 [Aspergillus ibericus CBS 121593]RAL00198.1 hypothetical protein BO80DRAFT_109811 [Aspergillus ibericus CBS 121593]